MTSAHLIQLGSVLETLSRQTWEQLHAAKDLSVRFGEETITDLLALGIRRQSLQLTNWEQTTKPEEAIWGSDFEWWIGHDTIGWVRFSVQAKKLILGSKQYNFRHKVHGVSQLEILRDHAMRIGTIPLYCLYNYSANANRTHWQCCRPESFEVEDLGCTVVHLRTIRNLAYGQKNFDFIHRNTGALPWRCLASCPQLRRLLWRRRTDSIAGQSGDTNPRFDDYQETDVARAHYEQLPDMIDSIRRSGRIDEVDRRLYGGETEDNLRSYKNDYVDRIILPKWIGILEFEDTDNAAP